MASRIPTTLSPSARDKYVELSRILRRRGTLTPGDTSALEIVAETWARWRLYVADVHERGAYVTEQTLDGPRSVPNPSTKLAVTMENSLRASLKELGITPASRMAVKPAAPARAVAPKSLREKLAALGED